MVAAKKAAPRKAAPRKAAAKPAVPPMDPTPDPWAAYASLYPKGTTLWWYTSKDGTRIPFPQFSALEPPTRQFWRRIYNLDDMFQAFEWMNWAKVPAEVQALTDHLDEGEYRTMFEAWFKSADLTAGE